MQGCHGGLPWLRKDPRSGMTSPGLFRLMEPFRFDGVSVGFGLGIQPTGEVLSKSERSESLLSQRSKCALSRHPARSSSNQANRRSAFVMTAGAVRLTPPKLQARLSFQQAGLRNPAAANRRQVQSFSGLAPIWSPSPLSAASEQATATSCKFGVIPESGIVDQYRDNRAIHDRSLRGSADSRSPNGPYAAKLLNFVAGYGRIEEIANGRGPVLDRNSKRPGTPPNSRAAIRDLSPSQLPANLLVRATSDRSVGEMPVNPRGTGMVLAGKSARLPPTPFSGPVCCELMAPGVAVLMEARELAGSWFARPRKVRWSWTRLKSRRAWSP